MPGTVRKIIPSGSFRTTGSWRPKQVPIQQANPLLLQLKYAQRLDYARLAEVLHERGLADPGPLGEILQASISGGTPFAEALVYANLVSEWDLASTVCEIFNLPFLTPDHCTPDLEAAEAIGHDFLIQHGLVPLGRFGQVISLAMPGLVPADVLGLLAAQTDLQIQPIVSTVSSNRRWIEEQLQQPEAPADAPAASPAATTDAPEGSWENLFDDADAAVKLQLDADGNPVDSDREGPAASAVDEPQELDIDAELAELDMDDLEISAVEMSLDADSQDSTTKTGVDLPPMPDFNLGEDPAA